MPVAYSKKSRKRALAHQKKALAAIAATAAVAATATGAVAAPIEHSRPATEGFGPMRAYRYCGARAMANQAAGLKEYEVTAPVTASETPAHNLSGRKSYEYAPAHAVPTGGDAKKFNRRAIGRETAKLNKLAELDELFRRMTDAEQKEFERYVKERRKAKAAKNAENKSREEMGDFLDDEDGYENAQEDLLLLEGFLA